MLLVDTYLYGILPNDVTVIDQTIRSIIKDKLKYPIENLRY